MLEKAATIKRFEYSAVHSELKKQTDTAKKQTQITKEQNQRLEKVFAFNITALNKNLENSDLAYNSFNFNKCSISDEDFKELSDNTKYKHLQKIFDKINKTQEGKI